MILSRFWYAVLALALGGAVFVLYVASALYNRTGERAMSEALSADSSAVGWYLKDDARSRSSALIAMALSPDLRAALAKASTEEGTPTRETAEKARVALRKLATEVDPDAAFDGLWAVDAAGRVIASTGDVVAPGEDWELGGYALVADALHGWIRDDAWVWKGRILRVVARPVEVEVNAAPVGAIIGAKIVDDRFATAVSKRTGAAVGFYAEGARVASWAPEGFDKANLDVITQDLKGLEGDKEYAEKGRSEPRVINAHLGVVYARLPGEAWDLGAGYAVGRLAANVESPLDFLDKASEDDKQSVPTVVLILLVLGAALAGFALTLLEHTKPLSAFAAEAARFAGGHTDHLQPSKFGGAYRKIAADVNDGVEKVVVKGGGARRAADMDKVLGPLPDQPSMSAFAVPGGPGDSGERPSSQRISTAKVQEVRASAPGAAPRKAGPPAPRKPVAPAIIEMPAARISVPEDERITEPTKGEAAPITESLPSEQVVIRASSPSNPHETTLASPSPGAAPEPAVEQSDEIVEWRHVYEEFLGLKRQCGEATATLTFEKFKGTLERNKSALVARHNCARVKFTVYVKDGKAALKASPVK